MRYAMVIEKAQVNYSAYVPDLPGCVATGATTEEIEAHIREAIEFHLDGLREDGLFYLNRQATSSTSKLRHNNHMQRSTLRAAADAERWASPNGAACA